MTNDPCNAPIRVAALYCFAAMEDCGSVREKLLRLCEKSDVRGTIILAPEGINGTIAGSDEAVAKVVAHIHALPGCDKLEPKYSRAETMPFYRLKVRIKREIVTMGEPTVDPIGNVGDYVNAEDWNAMIADPETIVIDTRNAYEVKAGTFAGAINPATESFRDFPQWFRDNRETLLGDGKAKRIAMFCTGGIRCEKATALLREEGVEDVFHLKGGILKYLEKVPAENSRWNGECFVFDERVTVKHGLERGTHKLCRACRIPLSSEDRTSPRYVEGVSCPYCRDARDDAQRERYAERQKQMELAEKRGEAHVGAKRNG